MANEQNIESTNTDFDVRLDEFLIKEQEFKDTLKENGYKLAYELTPPENPEFIQAQILDGNDNLISQSPAYEINVNNIESISAYLDGFKENYLQTEIPSVKMEDFLTLSGRDVFGSLTLSPEMQKNVNEALAEAISPNGKLDWNTKLDLVNMGSRTDPSLIILDGMYEVGYINVKDNYIDFNINDTYIASKEVEKEAKDIIKEQFGEEMAEQIEKTDKEYAPDPKEVATKLERDYNKISEPEAEKAADAPGKTAKDVYQDINGNMEKVPKFILKEQQRAQREDKVNEIKHDIKGAVENVKDKVDGAKEAVENSKVKQLFNERKAAKESYKGALNDLIAAQRVLNNALAQARDNGFDEKANAKIEECRDNVANLTNIAIQKREEYKKVFRGEFDKEVAQIKAAANLKVNNGIDTLRRIGKDVELANKKFATGVKTAYVGLDINTYKHEMKFYAKNYAADKVIENKLERKLEKTQNRYDRFNAVKNALKNVKNAALGREMNAETSYSERQQKKIDYLKDEIKYQGRICEKDLAAYDYCAKTMDEMVTSINKERAAVGLEPKNSFEEKVAKAKVKYEELKNKKRHGNTDGKEEKSDKKRSDDVR